MPGAERTRVELQRRRAAGGFTTVTTALTTATGSFRITTRLPAGRPTVVYRVRSSASGTQTPTATAAVTGITRVSRGRYDTFDDVAMSDDGRMVAFSDRVGRPEGYLWSRGTDSFLPLRRFGLWADLSADGTVVTYSRFVGDDSFVYVWDRSTRTTTRVGKGSFSTVSGNGRYIAYLRDGVIFHDLVTGTTTNVGLDSFGASPSMSADGRYVAVASSLGGGQSVVVWDRDTGDLTGVPGGTHVGSRPQLSADGRFVTYVSADSAYDPTDANGKEDVFVWDRAQDVVTRITTGDHDSNTPTITSDGRFVAFQSSASNLVPDDPNKGSDVFVWDRESGAMTRITDGNAPSGAPLISATGRYIVFLSAASNLVPGDVPGSWDLFTWDRGVPSAPAPSR